MTNAVITLDRDTFALKVGKNTRDIAAETALAIGHKDAMLALQNLAFKAAFENTKHGRYRAAAEIMGFAAHATQLKAVKPETGDWNKARIGMLAELVLGRKAPDKGWPQRALLGRAMAKLVSDMIEGKAVPPSVPPTDANIVAETVDPMSGVAPAPF